MGWTPGDHHCDLCGAIITQDDELVALTCEDREGGHAEICRSCTRRPIADLLALMDDPTRRARPASRPISTRNFTSWEGLFR